MGEITEGNDKGKAIVIQVWTGPYGSRRMKIPEFLDSHHMKVLSPTYQLIYAPGDNSGVHFSWRPRVCE